MEKTKPIELPIGVNARLIAFDVLSPLNRWGTGEEIGRNPNPNIPEDRRLLFNHWMNFGGLTHFRETFSIAA